MVQMLLTSGAQLKRPIGRITLHEFDALAQAKRAREPNAEVIALLELAAQKQA